MSTAPNLAATVAVPDPEAPDAAVALAELSEPAAPEGWAEVDVLAATLNMHDVWMLRGVGVRDEALPLVLGSDAAGRSGGREVIVHAVLSDTGEDEDATLSPDFGLLSDKGHGTFARRIAVPARNLVEKPPGLSWEQAAALPTAWLTAWRMLFAKADLRAGQTVLVQGAGGGVGTAALLLARAAGAEVIVTGRSEDKRRRALGLGASAALEPGARLPRLADVVVETVGATTWEHSLRACRPGGAVVVCGATSGFSATTDLARLFARQLRIFGSTMGSAAELRELAGFVSEHGIQPPIDSVAPLERTAEQVRRMLSGEAFGKLAIRVGG